jgi:hypothetical protein
MTQHQQSSSLLTESAICHSLSELKVLLRGQIGRGMIGGQESKILKVYSVKRRLRALVRLRWQFTIEHVTIVGCQTTMRLIVQRKVRRLHGKLRDLENQSHCILQSPLHRAEPSRITQRI